MPSLGEAFSSIVLKLVTKNVLERSVREGDYRLINDTSPGPLTTQLSLFLQGIAHNRTARSPVLTVNEGLTSQIG